VLTTYAEVQEGVARYLQRDDLVGHIPDFIVMAEARFNSILRVSQMETSATITISSGSGSLPTDYLAWRRVYANSSPVIELEAIDPGLAIHQFPDTSAGTPAFFYVAGSSIYTKPVSSSNLIMQYYQKIPALASNTTGNWVTSRSPQLYLYAACLEAAPMIDDDQRITTWGLLLERSINELHQSDTTGRYAKVATRVRGETP
jgi:hypothetical protein